MNIPNEPTYWRPRAHPEAAVRGSMRLSVLLTRFRENERWRLSKADRLTIVDQALILLERNYVHLPLKRAMHAVEPIQRLRLIRSRIEATEEDNLPSEMRFHQDMQRVFTSTRDFHTSYRLPEPFKRKTAYLPFLIEEYFERVNGEVNREPKFLVSKWARGFDHPTFEPGVEVLYWNGTPINRAIEINGDLQSGGNLDARFANGLDSLTIRPLHSSLPPDEEWVVLTYRSLAGETLYLKQDWLVFIQRRDGGSARETLFGRKLGIDIKKAAVNDARKVLFVPNVAGPSDGFEPLGRGMTRRILRTGQDDTFRAWRIRARRGREFGYIRIFTFSTENTDAFVREFARLVRQSPSNGLIIDVRNNGGGQINAGERLLQLLTPHRIKPELFELINTPLNLEISRSDEELNEWTQSLVEAVETGAAYSRGFPLTDEESCNTIGQIYFGPVVLIIDALCYSTTDMFAAGFEDHGIGTILGVSGNTGAGGANVWSHEDLSESMGNHPHSPYEPLPHGVGMGVAFRRSIRVGEETAGRPLEDLGVVPKDRNRHFMTRNDLLHDNQDLLSEAVRILASQRPHELSARINYRKGTLFITPRTENISRLDVYVNGQPARKSIDVRKAEREFELKVSRRGRVLLKGFDGAGKLVAVIRKKF